MNWIEQYKAVRAHTEAICAPLQTEDYVVQPVVDVSPPKWHLGHTAWFFETFLLQQFADDYKVFNESYNYVFNSYYETIGARVIRTDRGNLSRPSVADIYAYRTYVDEQMWELLSKPLSKDAEAILTLGLNHEQQHCELLFSDIKYILGNNPLFPVYASENIDNQPTKTVQEGFIKMNAGLYEMGYDGDGFCFDNELGRHKVYLNDYEIASSPVSNKSYVDFINDGGYKQHQYWHAEGWDWVKSNGIQSPMYWHFIDGAWHYYTLAGLLPVAPDAALCHVSFYEAAAFAAWSGARLPIEAEWEAASPHFEWGERWEWTGSSYLPYPGFAKAAGAIGEYNGKFMINQMVLRGASIATPAHHSRNTYRNFFHPHLRWQFTGIRLVKDNSTANLPA